MAPPSQKADVRPISFVLHNTARGKSPVEVPLVIRPEDLTRADTSRLSTVQTLGGAWADNFGPGIPTVQIAGHTGWGAGDRPDGIAQFEKLYNTVFKEWHNQRADAVKSGYDPDKVKLIFLDGLDNFEWVVAPQTFILKRNRSRPLLSQYQINLTWLSDDVAETKAALAALKSATNELKPPLKAKGLASLAESINALTKAINAKISKFLGPIQKGFDSMLKVTAKALTEVNKIISSVKSVSATLTNGLIGLATSLTRAAANATSMIHSIISLPMQIKAQFQRVGAAFENAYCVLTNVFRPRQFLSRYDDLYGASNCSSTSGGAPISRYNTENPFPVLLPVEKPLVTVTPPASAALNALNTIDAVLHPLPANALDSAMLAIGSGVKLAA